MVVAVVDDLLFSSKIRGAAAHAGETVTFVREAAAVVSEVRAKEPTLVIFDLDREQLDPISAIRALRSDPALKDIRIAGFVSHVHTERIEAARAAGADVVVARSGFVSALPRLFARAAPVDEADRW